MTSKRRKQPAGKGRAGARPRDPLSLDGIIHDLLRHANELLAVDDPLEAEDWASGVLGVFYKPDVPLEVREKVERSFGPDLVQAAERLRNATGLAVLCALAGVTGDEIGAREAAGRMASRGVPRPRWADEIGTPRCTRSFSATTSSATRPAATWSSSIRDASRI